MARITSKQAKEMNEAYAKVYQNLQEKERPQSKFMQTYLRNKAGQDDLNNKTKGLKLTGSTSDASLRIKKDDGNNNTSNKTQVKTQSTNNTSSSGGNSGGGLKTLSGNDSKLSDRAQQKVLAMKNNAGNNQTVTKPFDKSQDIGGTSAIADKDKITPVSSTSGPGTGSVKLPPGGLSKLAPKNNQQQSGGNQQSGGQQPQSGVNRSQTVVRDGNKTTTTTRTSADNTTPAGAKAVDDFKAQRAARLDRYRSGGGIRPDGQGPSSGGTPPSTQGGAQKPVPQQSGAQKPGLMGRLGSLAGKAVGAARSAAGNIKQGVQSAASNVKQGAQAVAGGIRQGAQAVSGALANKGPIQGRQTGAQRRAQQTTARPQPTAQPAARPQPTAQPAARPQPTAQPAARPQPTAQPAARPVQAAPVAKPVPQAQPVAKPAPQQAQPTYKTRIGAFLNNSKKGAVKKPSRHTKVTSVMDMEGYDPMENLFDDTVQFLVSEGHAKDKSEAISIMSESEFIDAFNQELNG